MTLKRELQKKNILDETSFIDRENAVKKTIIPYARCEIIFIYLWKNVWIPSQRMFFIQNT